MEKKEWVVCINNSAFPSAYNFGNFTVDGLMKDEIYPLIGSKPCSCGNVSFDVGLKNQDGRPIYCYNCGAQIVPGGNGPRWFYSKRFRAIDMGLGEKVCESIERHPVKQLA